MRSRQVKPEFWRDAAVASLSDAARLFYIGLWLEADDSGWLRWKVQEIGADLYPYRPAKSREAAVERYAAAIVELPGECRLRILRCGHAHLPNLVKYQRFSGLTKQVHTYAKEHQTLCPQEPAGTRESPTLPARFGSVREGSEGVLGGTDDDDRDKAVETLREIIADPKKSEQQKKAARRGLEQWGFA